MSTEEECETDRAMKDNDEEWEHVDTSSTQPAIDPLLSRVQIAVGLEQKVFTINEALICRYCPFFANAFNGNFIEATKKTLTLPDDDPERFDELVRWLHGDGYPDAYQSWRALSTTWFFADKYHIDQLQNAVIDTIYQKFASREEGINISFETLDFIAENTSDNKSSPLRRIFADILTNGVSLQQLSDRLDQIPAEFLQDMVLALKRTASKNAPTNISLLTNPISSYYSSSIDCKSIAGPANPTPISEVSSEIYCDGIPCRHKNPQEPIKGLMHICTNHNLTLCQSCRHNAHGHRKKLFTFTTAPYKDTVTGGSLIVDGHINDSGFYCDGPKCDPDKKGLAHEMWAIQSGDRYHCLECDNIDYCSVCIRDRLDCKDAGHSLLRIRPIFAKYVPLTEEIDIKTRQERVARGACWRCGSEEHGTAECAEKAVIAGDVAVED